MLNHAAISASQFPFKWLRRVSSTSRGRRVGSSRAAGIQANTLDNNLPVLARALAVVKGVFKYGFGMVKYRQSKLVTQYLYKWYRTLPPKPIPENSPDLEVFQSLQETRASPKNTWVCTLRAPGETLTNPKIATIWAKPERFFNPKQVPSKSVPYPRASSCHSSR